MFGTADHTDVAGSAPVFWHLNLSRFCLYGPDERTSRCPSGRRSVKPMRGGRIAGLILPFVGHPASIRTGALQSEAKGDRPRRASPAGIASAGGRPGSRGRSRGSRRGFLATRPAVRDADVVGEIPDVLRGDVEGRRPILQVQDRFPRRPHEPVDEGREGPPAGQAVGQHPLGGDQLRNVAVRPIPDGHRDVDITELIDRRVPDSCRTRRSPRC